MTQRPYDNRQEQPITANPDLSAAQGKNPVRQTQFGDPSVRTSAGTRPPGRDGEGLRADDSHIGNKTLFRTTNFFVHAVVRKTSALRMASGNTSLLEQIRWTAVEEQRVSDAETRRLPNVEQINPVLWEIVFPIWFEAIVVLIILGLVTAIHALNVFGFPAYQPSEGTLLNHAWANFFGMFQPHYLYPYNQTPLGLFGIGAWTTILDLFVPFGNAINSGRALMLLTGFGSSLLVYLIARRLSGSRGTGLLAMLLFALSPLGITDQRELLLDNLGIFWLLLSLHFIISSNSRFFSIVFAGIALSIAILSKGIFIVFLPAILYAVYLHVTIFQRKFAMISFIYVVLAITSTFVLLAVLRGELISFWTGIVGQVQSDLSKSDLPGTWNGWSQRELPLFIASAVAVVINMLGGIRNRLQWLLAFLLLSIWIFIVSTTIVFPSYFVILLPLMALNIAMALNVPMKWLSRHIGFDLIRVLIIFAAIGALIPYRVQQSEFLTTQDATTAQVSAINWIRQNVPQNATILADSDLAASLHDSGGIGAKDFTNAYYYRDALFNHDTSFSLFHDDWTKIDEIALDLQMQQDLRDHPAEMILIDRALHHADLQQNFGQVQIYRINRSIAP